MGSKTKGTVRALYFMAIGAILGVGLLGWVSGASSPRDIAARQVQFHADLELASYLGAVLDRETGGHEATEPDSPPQERDSALSKRTRVGELLVRWTQEDLEAGRIRRAPEPEVDQVEFDRRQARGLAMRSALEQDRASGVEHSGLLMLAASAFSNRYDGGWLDDDAIAYSLMSEVNRSASVRELRLSYSETPASVILCALPTRALDCGKLAWVAGGFLAEDPSRVKPLLVGRAD